MPGTGSGGSSGTGNSNNPSGSGSGTSMTSGSGGSVGTGGAGGSSGASGSAGAGGTAGDAMCDGTEVTNAKRVIRLSFNQISNSIGALLGDAFRKTLVTKYQITSPTLRTFPPLGSAREGSVVTDSLRETIDQIAQDGGKYALDNFATVTGCATATDACAQTFLANFATKAYRRPITADEKTRLLQVYTDTKTAGGTINEGVQYGVYAVLQSPLFLYRTEFGDSPTKAGPLSPYEMATQLSMFLTDAPPDQPLLDAAAQNKLAADTDVKSQVARILKGDGAKANFEAAIISYFALPNVLDVVIDPAVAKDFNDGLANSMYHESELFVKSNLWGGKVSDLILSRKTTINQSLATLYGVTTFPPAGAKVDADGFAPVELPDNRAGMLTQAAFLTSKARPDVPSVVGRGLIVNKSIVCAENPAPPPNLSELIAAANAKLPADASERDRANYRAMTSPCLGCHTSFDPYGIVLQNYDVLGKYITTDSLGRMLDTSVTLPEAAGSGKAQNAVDMAKALASGDTFATCMSKNMLVYAMAEGSNIAPDSCSTQAITKKFKGTDQSFTSLLQEVAGSQGFMTRNAGADK